MRKLGYKNTHKHGIKRVYEKKVGNYMLAIAYTEIGEICDYYVYYLKRKFINLQEIDELKEKYKMLLEDLRRLRNGWINHTVGLSQRNN